MDWTPAMNGTKIKNKWDYIKLECFCAAKRTINKMKMQPTKWEEIFANGIQRANIQNVLRTHKI